MTKFIGLYDICGTLLETVGTIVLPIPLAPALKRTYHYDGFIQLFFPIRSNQMKGKALGLKTDLEPY